jgi:hypothetical protein
MVSILTEAMLWIGALMTLGMALLCAMIRVANRRRAARAVPARVIALTGPIGGHYHQPPR